MSLIPFMAAAAAFQSISGSAFFYDKGGQIFYKDYEYAGLFEQTVTYRPLPCIDRASFRVLGNQGFAADKDHVYFRKETVNGAVPDAFRAAPLASGKESNHFFIDYSHVYADGKVLDDADPASFEQLVQHGVTFNNWYHDKENVYWTDEITAEKLHGKDEAMWFITTTNRHPYYPTVEVRGGVADGMEAVDEHYAKTKTAVYFEGRPLEHADPSTWHLIKKPQKFSFYDYCGTLSADAAHIYLDSEIIFLKTGPGKFVDLSEEEARELPKKSTLNLMQKDDRLAAGLNCGARYVEVPAPR